MLQRLWLYRSLVLCRVLLLLMMLLLHCLHHRQVLCTWLLLRRLLLLLLQTFPYHSLGCIEFLSAWQPFFA
jgi:hypothetical protein